MNLKILSNKGYEFLKSKAKNHKSEFLKGIKISDEMKLDYQNHIITFDQNDIDSINKNYHIKYDYENALIIYKYFKKISAYEASDKRLWAYLSCYLFKDYTLNRWKNLQKKNVTYSTIKSRFFYDGAGLNSRERNSIARLFWGVKNTIDNNNDDDIYHLTKIYFKIQDLTTLFARNIGTYNNLLITYLKFLKENESLIDSKKIQKINKKLNLHGGVQDLSSLSNSKIYDVLNNICTRSGYDF